MSGSLPAEYSFSLKSHVGLLQVRRVEERVPRTRQTLMFSATIPPRIERMAAELMSSPLHISVGVVGGNHAGVLHAH